MGLNAFVDPDHQQSQRAVLSGGGLWRPPSPAGPAYRPTNLHFTADTGADAFIQRARRTAALSPDLCSSSGSKPPPEMSVAVAESCFLSALQPATSCTAYMVPSDGPSPDPGAKARRVQEQVRMRLAERKSCSLPRLDASLVGPAGESHQALSSNPLCWLTTCVLHPLQ